MYGPVLQQKNKMNNFQPILIQVSRVCIITKHVGLHEYIGLHTVWQCFIYSFFGNILALEDGQEL